MVKPGQLVILAISAGPDSMALLHIMSDLSSRLGFEVAAAHLNHGLRPEADEEEAFVRGVCQKRGIKCFTRRVSVAELARARKSGLEETGRFARYSFFRGLRQEIGAHRVATAHHKDDVAESVLLHLLRGSGIKGLRGIMPVNGFIIRPLLRVSKQELLQYLETGQIAYCKDETNEDQYYLRNRIRHRLLPLLSQEFNPRIVDKLNQLASIAADENEVMEEQTETLWKQVRLEEEQAKVVLDNQMLAALPAAFRRRIVQKALNHWDAGGWGWNDVELVLALSKRQKVGSTLNLHLKNRLRVIKSYDKMVFTTQPAVRATFIHELPVPGKVDIPSAGRTYRATIVDRSGYVPGPGVTGLDWECLSGPLFLRSRQNGDYCVLSGSKGRKKLKKYLMEARIPYDERDQLVMLAGEGHEVYAALGVFTAGKAAVGHQTRLVLKVEHSMIDNKDSDNGCAGLVE